jgi:iron complex outermembrane receptor protein
MVSKAPEFEPGGEVALRYGSFERKEALADLTGPIVDGLAGRIVARVRDSESQTEYVPDDRVMIAPSLRWRPGAQTEVTLIGLYQEDDGGSTSQFLPLVGTLLPNPNGRLDNSLFIGKPGWDRYDGRLLQGTGIVEHRFSDSVRLSVKARYVDSDLTYLTHYPDSYTSPTNPYVDPGQRVIGLYADGSYAQLDIFSTDNNLRFDFDTGAGIEHVLLAGVDYSWNRVQKTGGYDYEFIDIYDIDYDALSNFGGGISTGLGTYTEDTSQKQLGFYLQDQIRIRDRVSIVLGVRRDHVTTQAAGSAEEEASATSFRAGIIAEILTGVSPFVSYTESFEPISGLASDGDPFVPKRGRQIEGGIKFHPDDATLVTATAYHIKETNRPIDDPSTPDPFDQMQAGSLTSKGFEIEASRMLPGNFEIIANYSYVKAEIDGTGVQVDNVPQHNASLWTTKTIALGGETSLRLGGGVRHSSSNMSYGWAFPDGIRTPAYTLVDALAEVSRGRWRLSVNATNLLGENYYSACLARGDCFNGAERNIFGTLGYRF